MNKKGDHVDWAISMGLFLVYLIGMFILLRPGVTPVYKPEGLLDILENKFINNVTYEVREIPLIIELCKGDSKKGECSPNKIDIEDLEENFDFNSPTDKDKKDATESCGCLLDQDPLLIKETTYYYTYYQKFSDKKTTDLKAECTPYDDKEEHCKIKFGASTTKSGINNDWLDGLKSDRISYEDLKKNWEFPLDKEFAIYVSDSEEKLGKMESKINGAIEPQGINLFIKQFKTQSVNKYGGITIPIIVNLRVW